MDPIHGLTSKGLGDAITDHRSSWVRTVQTDVAQYFIKTYDYPTGRDRRRGIGRNTAWAPSRAAREAQAARWLADQGFAAPNPVVVAEARRFGLLRRALLATVAAPGTDAERWFATGQESTETTDQALRELAQLVRSLHDAGFRHRNLNLRNLLVEPTPTSLAADQGRFRFTILDAPRFRLRRPGPESRDKLTTADWTRLSADVQRVLGPSAKAMLQGTA